MRALAGSRQVDYARMEIREESAGAVTIVAVSGRLDATSAPLLRERLLQRIDSGHHRFVLDFATLDFIDSHGLRALLVAAKRLSPVGGRMVLCGFQPLVRQAFDIVGFDKIFRVYDSREQAARDAAADSA